MPRIEVYASMWCGFCHRAKTLLKMKGAVWTEYDVDMESGRRKEMVARGGGYTVPQIFVDDRPIGGCDEIFALERENRLDEVLGLDGGGVAEETEHGPA